MTQNWKRHDEAGPVPRAGPPPRPPGRRQYDGGVMTQSTTAFRRRLGFRNPWSRVERK